MSTPRVLVFGFGNPGRRDDGLGPAFAAALETCGLSGVTVDSDYQLTVEDAATIRDYDVVLFVDAALAGPAPFSLQRLDEILPPIVESNGPRHPDAAAVSFSSHSASPGGVVALAARLFNAHPEAYVLGIRGYEFNEFGERLSPLAEANLAAALAFIKPALREGTLARVAAQAVTSASNAP
jgi:hydrogenase maturation protease